MTVGASSSASITITPSNPIVAPKSGKVVKLCVANEQPVEFDQPLVVIE